ncbi:MAG: M20/M25/M40 family metallo-hydrolase, partial [Pseudomonadota bacterium]
PRASTVLVGEPSMMKVVTGHKGGIGFDVHFRGFEVHSSLIHTGVSAIMMAAKLIDWANQMNAENAVRKPGPLAADFVPPYTTLHVGQITGGTAHNITAKDCRFDIEFRTVPGDDAREWVRKLEAKIADLETEMQAINAEAGIQKFPEFEVPGLKPETDGSAEALARRLTGDNGTNVVSYGTEAGQFQERGYSVVVCGPGDIAQAHQPNEFISTDQFQKGEAFMSRLVDVLAQ